MYWASVSRRPERLSTPPKTSMDWRRLVRTLVIFLTSWSVGEPMMMGKSALAPEKRVFASSRDVISSWGREGEHGG